MTTLKYLLLFIYFFCLSANQAIALNTFSLKCDSTKKKKKVNRKRQRKSLVSKPVKSLFEAFSLDVKLEDGPLAVGGGVVAPTVLLQESIKAVF